MFNNTPPKIYVSEIPDAEIDAIPANAVELTSGVDGYIVNDTIDGLSRPDADVSISTLAGANASRISGSHINERNIVFSVVPIPNTDLARERLYYTLPFNTMLRFYFVRHEKTVFIDGYIEKLSGAFKPGKPFEFTVSILCPFPWFQSVRLHTQDVPAATTTTEFTFDAVNAGDIECGFEVNQIRVGLHPWNSKTSNLDITVANRFFGYDGSIYLPYICTIPGKKAFKGDTRMSDVSQDPNSVVPAFSYMKDGAEWMQFRPGSNAVIVSCGSTDGLRFTWRDTYSGV